MKRSEAAEVVAMLVAAYPNAKTCASTSQVYETMLADLDAAVARAAVTRLIATSRFMPTIAEVREAAAEAVSGPVRSGADAWLDVVGEIRRIGIYGSPRFDDALVASIVLRWGWRALCDSPNEASDRARFIETYDGLARKARQNEVAGLALPASSSVKALKRGVA
jgi:hypothetical protein